MTSTVQTTRLRITPRGRRALATLVALPVLALGAWGATQATSAIAGAEAPTAQFETVVVQPGQTLWEIAESVAPGADVREVIADISSLNAIDGAIVPGQELAIPLEYAPGS